MADRFQHRRDTSENWIKYNPILLEGETGYEMDSDQYKVGDGERAWTDLPYRGDPCLQQEGYSKTTPMSQDATTKGLNKRTPKTSFLNVSLEFNNFAYNSFEEARLAVPQAARGKNQILVYQTIEKVVVEYFIGNSVSDDYVWAADSSWKAVGSGGGLNISEELKNYEIEHETIARQAVKLSDRKQGQLILYRLKYSGWVYEMFIGTDIEKWEDDVTARYNWRQIATDEDMVRLQRQLTDAINEFDTRLSKAITAMNANLTNSLDNFDKYLTQSVQNISAIAAAKADSCMLTPDNKLQLMSGTTPVGDPLELPTGILNLSYKENKEFESSADARKTVKSNDRILGQVITYKLNDGTWVLDQFIGESTASWESEGSWVAYALVRDLTPILLDLETVRVQVAGLDAQVKSKVDGGYTEELDENTLELVMTSNGAEVARIQLPKGGGGSGPTGVIMRLQAVGTTSIVVGDGADAIIKYAWTSIDQETNSPTGPGTVYITVNGIPAYSGEVPQGENQYNVKDSLSLGANSVRVRVTDGYNNVRNIMFTVQKASLVLTSTFADDVIYKNTPVAFRYTPIGSGEKKIRFWLNGSELAPDITTASGKQLTKNLTNLVAGANSIKVIAESNIEGSQLISNELYYEFIFADGSVANPVITISYRGKPVPQFDIINIPYLVYDPQNLNAEVELLIDGVLKQKLKVPRSRQYWSYSAYEQGTFEMEIRCKEVSKSVKVEVVASKYDIVEEKGDLRYKASAIGKSNNGEDRASWKYGEYDAVFKDFLWGEDGWHKDSHGDNTLKLIGDSSVEIGIKPFTNSVVMNGLTLTVEYSTENVTNTEAEVIKCMLDGVGIVLTPASVKLSSAQSTLSVSLDSSTKTSITFVVEKAVENRLVYLFVDGIMSGTLRYPATDNFAQSTPQGITLSSGGRSCTTMLYGIRWYENNLNYDQVFGNFIFDIENFNEKINHYNKNNVVDDYGSIDYNKSLEFLPCLTIIGELPTFKGDKKTVSLVYEDRKNPQLSWTAENVQIDVQGTSSQYYPRKNFKYKFKDGITYTESGEKSPTFSMEGTKMPAKVFCIKADFAESSGTHNTGIAVLIDEVLRKLGYKVPAQTIDDRIRTTVYGYPINTFHKESAMSNHEFVGKYNHNDDKSSEQVFGFPQLVEQGKTVECWEFQNNTSARCLFKSADFSGTDWLNDFEGRFPNGYEDPTNLKKVFEWVLSCKDNPTKFKQECKNWFNESWLVFYCLLTEVYGMVDQRAKNMFLTTYGEVGPTGEFIWYFIFYDNDTVLGINNEGLIAFNYNIETKDPFQDGHVWNGWDSVLWTLVETAYQSEITSLYQKIRQKNVLSSEITLEVLQNRQADKWCEAIYNRDGFYKYIQPLITEGNGAYLYALQGSRTRHRLWWVKNRFQYMDSKYRAGSYLNNYATMRLYTPREWTGVAPNADFEITINRPGYFHIKYGSYLTDSTRGEQGKSYKISAPATQFNDTETIIYGISAVKSLGDLSSKYLGTVDITNAIALEELLIGSLITGYKNQNLTVLHTGSNEMLRVVNVANCPNLKQSLELAKCYSLEVVEARGSGITGLELASSGVLKTLNLPASFTALYLKNQTSLTTLTLEGYKNLNTIVIDNVPLLDGYSFTKQCIETQGHKLGKVRLTNIDAVDSSAKTLLALLGMSGEDDNGSPTDVAFVTGKIHISRISKAAYDRLAEEMPYLTITYDTLLNVIEFEDLVVKAIAVANYDTNGDEEISVDEVQYKNIPAGLFTGSGAKYFDEAFNWGGIGSMIDNVTTLEKLSIQTGKAEIQDLPALKQLTLYSNHETVDTKPAFSYHTVKNCYSIQKFILTGRYKETAKKGAILAKQFEDNIEYYRMLLPLRGYDTITIDEKVIIDADDFAESVYPWGRDLKQLTMKNLRTLNLPTFENLETVLVQGFSENPGNSLKIPYNAPILSNLVIDDITGNTLDFLQLNGGGIRNFTATGLTCKGAAGSYAYFSAADSGAPGLLKRLDFPATYQPASFRFSRPFGWDKYTPFGDNCIMIIRSSNFIPCSECDNRGAVFTKNLTIYVPDGLVSTYKNATGWNNFGNLNKIQPLSNLG